MQAARDRDAVIEYANIIAAVAVAAVAAVLFAARRKSKSKPKAIPYTHDHGVIVPPGWAAMQAQADDPMDAPLNETIASLGLAGAVHTLDLCSNLAAAVAPESRYGADLDWDKWYFEPADVVRAIKTDGQIVIEDDCDWQRAMLWVLQGLGWNPEWLAECIVYVDAPGLGDSDYMRQMGNHYIAGVFVPGTGWVGFNCWNYGIVYPLETYRAGGYLGNNGWTMAGCQFVSYRLLSGRHWSAGSPD